jgi:hypothetical protein
MLTQLIQLITEQDLDYYSSRLKEIRHDDSRLWHDPDLYYLYQQPGLRPLAFSTLLKDPTPFRRSGAPEEDPDYEVNTPNWLRGGSEPDRAFKRNPDWDDRDRPAYLLGPYDPTNPKYDSEDPDYLKNLENFVNLSPYFKGRPFNSDYLSAYLTPISLSSYPEFSNVITFGYEFDRLFPS